jgi:hypothetical protein
MGEKKIELKAFSGKGKEIACNKQKPWNKMQTEKQNHFITLIWEHKAGS